MTLLKTNGLLSIPVNYMEVIEQIEYFTENVE